jgi:GDP-4-dehydro-6-deoxy-D-mannose reductase
VTFTHELWWAGRSVRAPLPSALRDVAFDPRYDYEPADATDPEAVSAVLRAFRPDVVVHCASALRDDPWQQLVRSNIQSVIGLVEAIAGSARPPPRLVLVSSGSVYGAKDPEALPLEETDPCVPLDLYAASKLAAEDIARILTLEHDVPLVRARVFNLLGPGLHDRHFPASVAGRISAITRGMARGPLQVGRLDTTRDLVDVRDASRGLLILAERAPTGPASLYNVASGRETPIRTVLDELLGLGGVGRDVVEQDVTPRTVDVPRSYADIGRARALGFEPNVSLVDSLSQMLRYYDGSVAS